MWALLTAYFVSMRLTPWQLAVRVHCVALHWQTLRNPNRGAVTVAWHIPTADQQAFPYPVSGSHWKGLPAHLRLIRSRTKEASKTRLLLSCPKSVSQKSSKCYNGNFCPKSHYFCLFVCLIVKTENLENLEEKEYFGIVTVRILVHERPVTFSYSSQLIVIQEEVVEIDGRQVRHCLLTRD